MNTQKLTSRCDEWKRVKDTEIAHLAGLIDGIGTVTVYISKSDDYSIGYKFQPIIRVIRPKDDEDPILGKLMEYCERNGVRYKTAEISQRPDTDSKSHQLTIDKPNSIEQFLEPLLPHLVTNYYPAIIMVDKIVPRMNDELHLDEDGLIELMKFADEIRVNNRRGTELKYDREYFKKEWSVS